MLHWIDANRLLSVVILARRRRPFVATAAIALLAVAAASSSRASLAYAQEQEEEKPTPTAAPPAAFEVDRAVGPLVFEVAFKLADKDDAHLQILFDEAEGEKSQQEREIFGMDFQPFEGARFVLSRSKYNLPLVSSLLAQVPEPKELEFKLKVELPQEGGLAVTMADGFPIVVATTPLSQRMKVQFAASGGVVEFTATKAVRTTRLKLDAAGEAAMLALRRPWDDAWGPKIFDPTLGPHLTWMKEAPAPAPVKQVRVVDRQEQAGVVVERYVVEFEEGIESPLLLARKPGEEKLPVLLCIAGSANGCTDPSILAALGSAATSGSAVAAFELIGTGERRSVLPHDGLRVPELELVGISSFDLAMNEAKQLVQWLRGRPDLDGTKVSVAGTGVASNLAEQFARQDAAPPLQQLPAGTPLPVELARVGDDYLHLRFDSCQLERALARRDVLPAPDTSKPLRERLGKALGRIVVNELDAIVFTPGMPPARWRTNQPAPRLTPHVTIVASDRGRRVALEEAISRLEPRDDECFVSFERPPTLPDSCATGAEVEAELGFFWAGLAKARGKSAEPLRVFTDGSVTVAVIASIAGTDIAVSSFTAAHAIPSFDILLARPYRAHRADDSLGVLTQGMPYEVFVPDALETWEIEDAVLALQERGVKVDWQDPVDSLRRPLTRHDRLAMWPRVRHAEFVR